VDPETSLCCPRCGAAINGEALYGPCLGCREELRATVRGEARQVDVGAYEPKSNVVPNQVATKE
jgi:hypothetical protein